MNRLFSNAAHWTAKQAGRAHTFIAALVIILLWAATGPLFGFSDTWQLIINTGTTIITFLIVFLIQNTQNRDAAAMHLKLDELIRAVAEARTGMVDLEDLSDEELEKLHEEFKELRERKRVEKEQFEKTGADRRGEGRRSEDRIRKTGRE